MNKITLLIVILVAIGIFFAGNVFAEEVSTLKILALKGKVLVKKAGATDWVEPKIGDILNKGDTIKTLEDGSAYLETSPNSGFTLIPNSTLVLGNTIEEKPVAEPYSEAARESVESVVAPGANQDGAASGY